MSADRLSVVPSRSGLVLPVSPGWLGARPRPVLLAGGCAVVALGVGVLAPTDPRDAIGLVVGVALVVAVLLRPMIGAFVLVALVPITSGLATGFPIAHVRVSEALIGVVGLTLIVFARRRDAVAWQALDWILLGYGLLWAASGVLADVSLHQHLSIDEWGTVFGQLQFFLVYRGVRLAVRTPGERRLAIGVLVLASVPVAVLAVLQEVRAPGVTSFITTITGGLTGGSVATRGGSVVRVTGPFVNWAALAGYLLPVVLVLVALALVRTKVRWQRCFVVAGVLAALALALTVEQSAIVCLLVGLVVLARRYDDSGRLTRWILAGGLVVVVAASPILVPRLVSELSASAGTGRVSWVPQTLSFRWSVWTRQYLPAVGAQPLTGYGVVLPSSIHWAYPESQYISFLIEGGVPMLAMFGVLAWAMVRGTLAATRSEDPFERSLGAALTIVVLSMLVMDAMWPFLSNGGMPQVLWGLMALTVPGAMRAPAPAGIGWELMQPAPRSGDRWAGGRWAGGRWGGGMAGGVAGGMAGGVAP
jgi:hypothetical protein